MTKIKTTEEKNWKNYLLKSEQFLESGRDAFLKKNWNAVGLNAVHSAISANDALTVYRKNLRSASEKHSDAVNLLLEVFSNSDDSKKNSGHLLWLVNRKNLVEYESRLFYEKEAEDSMKHAERFLIWAKENLP
jgi:HEPN domain.